LRFFWGVAAQVIPMYGVAGFPVMEKNFVRTGIVRIFVLWK
jgi:hypothetical protein